MSAQVINLSERRHQKRDADIVRSMDACFKAQVELWQAMGQATIDMIPSPWDWGRDDR